MDASRSPAWPVLVPPLALAGWTLFVWIGRIRNLAQEPGPIGEAGRWSLVGSIVFTVLGLVLVLAIVAARFGPVPVPIRSVVGALGVLTTGVWVVRAVEIALDDHPAGFIAVHLVLAVVSIGLAAAAWRAVAPHSRAEPREGERVGVGYPRSDG